MVARAALSTLRQERRKSVRKFGAKAKGQTEVCKYVVKCPTCQATIYVMLSLPLLTIMTYRWKCLVTNKRIWLLRKYTRLLEFVTIHIFTLSNSIQLLSHHSKNVRWLPTQLQVCLGVKVFIITSKWCCLFVPFSTSVDTQQSAYHLFNFSTSVELGSQVISFMSVLTYHTSNTPTLPMWVIPCNWPSLSHFPMPSFLFLLLFLTTLPLS